MKKFSMLILLLTFVLIVSACTSQGGLLLKEAALKQMELESFEGKSTLTVDINMAEMKNVFELELDTKQVDMLNSVVDIHMNGDLLALAGLDLPINGDEKVTLSLISKNGDSIITTSKDDIGVKFSDMSTILEDGTTEEEFEQIFVSIQDKFKDIMKDYLEDYSFSLNQIESHGQVSLQLPNGESVLTEHIEINFTVLELIEMLQYSINHLLENDHIQESVFETMVELQLRTGDVTGMEEEINPEELQEVYDMLSTEFTTAMEEFVSVLEEAKTNYLSDYEDIFNDFTKLSANTYIGVNDKETYQVEYELEFTYTDEIAALEIEELNNLFAPGDSIKISSKDQIWNHNKTTGPIDVPNQLVLLDELMELESIEDFKAIAGEDSLLALLVEQLAPLFQIGEFSFVEFHVDDNKAFTMEEEFDVKLYIKNGQLMVPLALVGEQMGAEVTWIEETRQIIVEGYGHLLDVNVAANSVTFDGESRSDIVVDVINGTSYINVRPFAESMGWTVLWIEEIRSAVVLP